GRATHLSRAVHLHGAAVQLDQVAHDVEPEPEAALRARRARVGLAKALEHVREELPRDAGAAVAHGDDRARIVALQAHVNAAADGRELDRVDQQVPDHLLQPARIALNRPGVGVDGRPQPDVPGAGGGAYSVDGGLDDRDEADRPHVQTQLAPDRARYVEQVVDDVQERADALLHSLPRALGGGLVEPPAPPHT